jgi:mono/diheme cytochrome c family protein
VSSALFLGGVLLIARPDRAGAGPLYMFGSAHHEGEVGCCTGDGCPPDGWAGTWYWLRSPEEEKQVVMGLYNRYCIRCHMVDGKGSWDIPGVPNFADPRWQASRSDSQIVRIILEGRGAVMPPFRGALTLEEAWGMQRYLRTLVPGSETPRPETGTTKEKPMSTLPEKIGTTPTSPPPQSPVESLPR